MNTITIFIIKHWAFIILFLVLILMGIIGYIADSNGFIPKRDKKKKLSVKKSAEEISKPNIDEFSNVSIENEIFNLDKSIKDEKNDIYKKDLIFEDSDLNFEQFESEFDRVIPEKSIISDELRKYMDEFQIEPVNMNSKNKEKEVYTNIQLPEIKSRDNDTDIWSF